MTEKITPVLNQAAEPQLSPEDEKGKLYDEYEVGQADEITAAPLSREMERRVLAYYGRELVESEAAPKRDIATIIQHISDITEEEAMTIILDAIQYHSMDPNFPSAMMTKIKKLSLGYKEAEMDVAEWSFDLKLEAVIIHYHSPYPEVRAVTDPYDDVDEACETPRAYFLGLCFMAGATSLNTFFTPRQPAISISSTVLQLLLPPCGIALAKILPNWNWTVPAKLPLLGGSCLRLNPGPWTYKEQTLATIMFTIASGAGGTYYVYLVQMLPQYLNQTWVNFSYEILLALCVEYLGFGFAGILRRFVIFPVAAIWPKILPALALNRALMFKEKKGEVINGWKFTRYRFFTICAVSMFIWFWVPNTFFQAIRLFNWMTWIAPDNYALGMITGSYGGMGFNPLSTLDWNTSGSGDLVTPFFSTAQQYIARVLSGLIIIGMHWGNMYWGAYMPINSNESFDNTGKRYNVSRIMGDNGYVDVNAYAQYGPPFFSAADVFGQGAWFAWYALVFFYVTIRNWHTMSNTFVGIYHSLTRRQSSIYEGHNDAHTRMIRKYKEVPEWWFLCILLFAFATGVAALEGWPTYTPWWSLLTVMVLNFFFLVPSAILLASANVTFHTGVLFQMLAGIWFAGNPQAQIIMQSVSSSFHSQADSYISDLKIAHYAKVPPRAVFRAQLIAVFLNCLIFIGLLNWMVENFNGGGTLCTWSNPQRFVCGAAVLYYGSAVRYGAFGVRNMFKLYPIFPWCFLIGAVVGVTIAVSQKYGPRLRERCANRWSEARYATWNKYFFAPLALLAWFDPAVFWSGALHWTGGSNLTYATNGLYLSFIFMYYIKRRYSAWWEKYNYLISAGFGIGVAISGIMQTLIFAFSNGGNGIRIDWWGNNVQTAGVDYQSYVQNATLLPVPEIGYFGPDPDDWPMDFGGLEKQFGY